MQHVLCRGSARLESAAPDGALRTVSIGDGTIGAIVPMDTTPACKRAARRTALPNLDGTLAAR